MKSDDRSSRSWASKQVDADALEALQQGLAPNELWSLLLDVSAARAKQRTSGSLREQWDKDRFVAPSYVDQRKQLEIDRLLLDVATGFEALELSPVAPLGVCTSVAPGSQNRIVATMRGTEVVSDPTNVLALESAKRLRRDPKGVVRLATNHRCVRAQALPKGPGFAAHFKLFCLTTAGHETANHGLLVGALIEHIRFHLDAFARLDDLGFELGQSRVRLLSTPARAHLADRIAEAIPTVKMERQSLEQTYYHGLRFMIGATAKNGDEIALSDGGAFDWLERLMSNRRMAFVASAIGSQRIAAVFAGS
jgi:hypothetical protein